MHIGALSRYQAEANNPMSDSASWTSSNVSTTASLNGSSSSLQSVHGISSSSADNSQSTPRARQGNSTVAGSCFGASSRWVLIPNHNFLCFHMQQILCFLKIYWFSLSLFVSMCFVHVFWAFEASLNLRGREEVVL